MIVVIDNYDSFTYNLVQYLGELGAEMEIFRNDAVTVGNLERLQPDAILISPGPGLPKDAGISSQVIQTLGKQVPTLGVCLGHQCIGKVFGGRVERAPRLMHGKTSLIHHGGDSLFVDIPDPFEATRYHSLIVSPQGLPTTLQVTATTSEGEIMALRHKEHPIFGVQFHPESILTEHGKQILENFIRIGKQGNRPTDPLTDPEEVSC